MIDFDALPWHDTRLLSMHIDRSNAGHRDEVQLRVQWPDGTDATLLFTDVCSARFDLNFGVVADESFMLARCLHDSEELMRLRDLWRRVDVAPDDLKCFEFETASTASRLQIYARRFEAS